MKVSIFLAGLVACLSAAPGMAQVSVRIPLDSIVKEIEHKQAALSEIGELAQTRLQSYAVQLDSLQNLMDAVPDEQTQVRQTILAELHNKRAQRLHDYVSLTTAEYVVRNQLIQDIGRAITIIKKRQASFEPQELKQITRDVAKIAEKTGNQLYQLAVVLRNRVPDDADALIRARFQQMRNIAHNIAQLEEKVRIVPQHFDEARARIDAELAALEFTKQLLQQANELTVNVEAPILGAQMDVERIGLEIINLAGVRDVASKLVDHLAASPESADNDWHMNTLDQILSVPVFDASEPSRTAAYDSPVTDADLDEVIRDGKSKHREP